MTDRPATLTTDRPAPPITDGPSPLTTERPAPPTRERPAPRPRILLAEAAIVGVVAIVIACVLLAVWRAYWSEPFAYDGDANYYAMVVKTIGRYGTYLHNPHLGWPFGQNLTDYPEGGDNLHWLILTALQTITGSTGAAMNAFYVLSFGTTAAAAHVVLRVLRVRRALAAVIALLFAFLPYHFARNEVHLQLSSYFMVPFAILIALALLSDSPPLTRTRDDGRWRLDFRSWRTWLTLAAAAVLASTGVYYLAFSLLLFIVAGLVAGVTNRSWRPVAAAAVLVGVSGAVLALNLAPSIIQRIEHGTPPGVAIRTPTETELYGLRISQLYAPRQHHRIDALARLSDKSQGKVVPSEQGQQLGVIGAAGLTVLVVVFVLSAVARRRDEWRSSRTGRLLIGLGLLAVTCMVTAGISSYSLLLSAAGLRTIRSWNRISIFIAFCALAAVAVLADRWVDRVGRRRPSTAPVMAGVLAGALLLVGLFDQTSPADRPDYAAIHARYSSDEAFFQAVADRLPPGTPVFELPHVPFPEVPPANGTGAYDQARGFLFQPQLAWSFGFIRGRHPEYPLEFANEPAATWLEDLAAIGFRGLVIDRKGYQDDGAALERDVTSVVGAPVLASADGRYSFVDLTAFADALRARVGDTELAARAQHVLASGPIYQPAQATAGR